MQKRIRTARSQGSACSRSRVLDAGIRIALALTAVVLLVPGNGLARQPERYSSSFCGSRAVAKEPNANFKVRLAISSKKISSGGTVRIRLENSGAVDAAYGYRYQLQRSEGSSWVSLPVGPFFSARLTVRSGRAGICQAIHIARSSAPGVYRVSKSAWPAAEKDERPTALVRATFRVAAGDSGR